MLVNRGSHNPRSPRTSRETNRTTSTTSTPKTMRVTAAQKVNSTQRVLIGRG